MHHAVAGARVVHVVGDDPGDVERAGDVDETVRRDALFRKSMVPALDRDAVAAEDVNQVRRRFAAGLHVSPFGECGNPSARTAGEREQSTGVTRELVERDGWTAPWLVAPADRNECREIRVAFARFREEWQMREQGLFVVASVNGDGELRADEAGKSRVARRGGEAHRSPQLVVIGEGERGEAELRRAGDKRFGQRRAVEEREARMAVQLCVRGHRGNAAQAATVRATCPMHHARSTTPILPRRQTTSRRPSSIDSRSG